MTDTTSTTAATDAAASTAAALTASGAAMLPHDGTTGALAGRVFDPAVGGPSVVAVRPEGVVDLSSSFPTMRALAESGDPAAALAAASGPVLGSFDDIVANTPDSVRDTSRPWLLSPIDRVADVAPRALLIIAPREDRLINHSQALRLYAAAREPKELYVVPGAGHPEAHAFGGADYEARVLAFLERYLDGASHQSQAQGRLYTGADFSPAGS